MYTLDEFLDRLYELREMVGGDAYVLVNRGTENEYETAIAEIQNVLPESFVNAKGETCHRSDNSHTNNTLRVVSIT